MPRKVVIYTKTMLESGYKNSVIFTTVETGFFIIEPLQDFFNKHTCLFAAFVHNLSNGIPFRVLISNFFTSPIKLRREHIVATVDEHRTNLVE